MPTIFHNIKQESGSKSRVRVLTRDPTRPGPKLRTRWPADPWPRDPRFHLCLQVYGWYYGRLISMCHCAGCFLYSLLLSDLRWKIQRQRARRRRVPSQYHRSAKVWCRIIYMYPTRRKDWSATEV